jgi:DNA-directed RNA polymerase specialized sigma24 family protein
MLFSPYILVRLAEFLYTYMRNHYFLSKKFACHILVFSREQNTGKKCTSQGGSNEMKATGEELSFHRRILARNDPIAFAELADTLYASLVQQVCKRAGVHADQTLVEEAVGQALLDYHDRPGSYNPERASLRSYLVMAAHRDFLNAAAKERRAQAHQVSLFELTSQGRDIVNEREEVESHAQAGELLAMIDEIFPDAKERRIVTLILNKVQSHTPYVQVLGIAHLPIEEQRKQVQLVKNRLTRRMRRRLSGM